MTEIKTAAEILDKHFPHEYYYPCGDSTKEKIHEDKCLRCQYDDAILAAMEEYKSQSLPVDSNVKSAGIFVKASERMPQLYKKVNGRSSGIPVIVENRSLLDGYITANGNLEHVSLIEWLDEENPVVYISNVDEAAEKLYPESSKAIYEIPKRQMANIERQAFKEGFRYASQLNRTEK